MTSKKVNIQLQGTSFLPEEHIYLSESLMKTWRITPGRSVILKAGASRSQVKIYSMQRAETMRISESLGAKVGIYDTVTLRASFKSASNTLHVGPFIGVLIGTVSQAQDRRFGAITGYCKELHDACTQQGAIVYYFTPNDIQGSDTLEAWGLVHGQWRKLRYPVPDVVHNRLTKRKLENKTSVQQFFQEVKLKHKASVFNEKFLNKTEVFQALARETGLGKYLPESHAYRGQNQLRSMLSRYSILFLKPVTGSLGQGIIRVSRSSNKSYVCQFASLNGTVKRSFSSFSSMYNALHSKTSGKAYQIQQGLRLVKTGGRPIDFRALVQKNHQGKWSVTSVVARTAGQNHFVSNLARGGTLSRPLDALSKSSLSGSARDCSSKLRQAAVDLAEGIDRQIQAHFGELGIDLAVDHTGRVWLLEINSKPSKNDNTPLEEGKIRPSVKQMVRYARYISGL